LNCKCQRGSASARGSDDHIGGADGGIGGNRESGGELRGADDCDVRDGDVGARVNDEVGREVGAGKSDGDGSTGRSGRGRNRGEGGSGLWAGEDF